jgi:hypothetical protein
MGMKDVAPARVRLGRVIAASGMIVLFPAMMLYMLVAFGVLGGVSAQTVLFLAIVSEVIILIICSVLEEQSETMTKLAQNKKFARILGWTGHSKQ